MRISEIVEAVASTRGIIKPIPPAVIDRVVATAVETFQGKGLPEEAVEQIIRGETDWSLSRMLLVDGHLAGFYLLREGSILAYQRYSDEDLTPYKHRRGVEGVALVVKPEYRNTGLGEQLKNLPKTMGFDYVFGMQLKTLNNLGHWLKRRRLIATLPSLYITLEDLR